MQLLEENPNDIHIALLSAIMGGTSIAQAMVNFQTKTLNTNVEIARINMKDDTDSDQFQFGLLKSSGDTYLSFISYDTVNSWKYPLKYNINDKELSLHDDDLFIDTSGNVGIGTTSPGQTLELYRSSASNPGIRLTGQNVNTPFTAIGFAPEITALTSSELVQANTGWGGLQLNGFTDSDVPDSWAGSPITLNSHIGLTSVTSNLAGISLNAWKSNGGTGRSALSGAEKVLQIRTGTTNLMTVQGNGNVGIGTSSPSSPLHIYGSDARLILQDDNNASSYFEIDDSSDTYLNIKKVTASGAPIIDFNPLPSDGTSNAQFRFFRATNTTGSVELKGFIGDNTATENFRIAGRGDTFFASNNGNVGIGTTTPTQPLSVQEKGCMTAIGGFAIKLTNKTGGNSVAGQLVKADTATNDAVILTAASDVECFGVFLDSGIADGAEAWVVVSGIADVAMKDNTAATRGNWVETSDEAGYADATSASPAAAPQHFNEIGHCIESVTAGGAGTHILARCVLHFN